MKIALIGYGKMGKTIEQVALSLGYSIVTRLSSNQWENMSLQEADVCLEFTRPDCVLENVKRIAKLKKQMIIGTTGWYDQIEEVRSIIEEYQIGVLYSPNFSIGIQLMLEILSDASRIMSAFKEYDVAGIEYHHHRKRDHPSGTALEIGKIIEENIPHVKKLHFSSVRCGSIPGMHTVLFDSPFDTITLTHEARNREGFARGAIQAAIWLQGKKGLYTLKDCMREMIQKSRH